MALCASKSVAKQMASTSADDTEETTFNEVEKLQEMGINMADINKLKGAGYATVMSVIQSTSKELTQIKGLSDAKVDKILEAARKLEACNAFMSGSDLMTKRNRILKMTTGSNNLDKLLGGGIESMCITELFGENRTGKTQVCHTLCVTAQLPQNMKGGNGKVCYVDTEGTFRPEKIIKIAERFGLEGDAVLDNILYARAYTHEQQMELLKAAAQKMVEEPFALLVVDSIMALFRVDFSGRGELSERQQLLGKMLSRIIKLCDAFNIACVMTNHVMSDPGGGLTFAPQFKPIGGHVLGHASTVRLSLRKGKGDQRIVKVYDAPNLPESEGIFAVSDAGIVDAE
ncbi:unnamed protein product [Vitrella brassicaformis CCMP3155]|uniref:Meiotic recombination protein DMC1 n=1 Tax=Vitrella brassicaformis (strain CCMP3155) TaxID=1169540 RepID=A0A0G4ECV0_VITBC|nr:unnamed protein product [Vitrella brassicaformis CCMP3155]|eukprot:CEL93147.1 unnamed protein product [Vitrella brassicaformis CCMP3155]